MLHTLPHALSLALVAALAAPSVAFGQVSKAPGDWPVSGGNLGFNRYSSLNQINRANAGSLKVKWTRPAVDPTLTAKYPDIRAGRYFVSTPVVVDGIAYAPDGIGLVEAFDAATGKTIWVQQPAGGQQPELAGRPTRGAALWRGAGGLRVISVRGNYLYALDARTGAPIPSFGEGGRISLRRAPGLAFVVSGAPLVTGDLVIVGGAGGGSMDYGTETKAVPEAVRAYDVRTGKLVWAFSPIPAADDPARSSWGNGAADHAGFMGAYGQLTVDEKLGYVYVPFSAAGPPGYGGWRPGDNLYDTTLVALDIRTGRKIWHYQTVHHDIWDYDLSAPPVLGDITVDGRSIKAVMQTGKMPYLYVLDRVTGKPVWPIVETAVPRSTIPGEQVSPTQPIPSRPAAYDRLGVEVGDLIDFTPELNAKAREIAKSYTLGPVFTPPTLRVNGGNQGTLILPGSDGGGNWSTGAFDPETQTYYAASATQPASYGLDRNEAKKTPTELDYSLELSNASLSILGPEGLSLVKPPYGRVTAIDLHTGDNRWVVANGDGPRNHPLLKDLKLPPLGLPGRVPVSVTKELVFMPESSDATPLVSDWKGGGNQFRVLDKASGSVLAQLRLPAGVTSTPITYLAQGKQFVLMAAGDSAAEAQWVALGL